mmetsp:Transcript_7574/g.11339  ORF Transcript_7574/g.11339 Transcript_7574/m.11339 type:complete len:273 (+) Transcript_7574:325-1143(+)
MWEIECFCDNCHSSSGQILLNLTNCSVIRRPKHKKRLDHSQLRGVDSVDINSLFFTFEILIKFVVIVIVITFIIVIVKIPIANVDSCFMKLFNVFIEMPLAWLKQFRILVHRDHDRKLFNFHQLVKQISIASIGRIFSSFELVRLHVCSCRQSRSSHIQQRNHLSFLVMIVTLNHFFIFYQDLLQFIPMHLNQVNKHSLSMNRRIIHPRESSTWLTVNASCKQIPGRRHKQNYPTICSCVMHHVIQNNTFSTASFAANVKCSLRGEICLSIS